MITILNLKAHCRSTGAPMRVLKLAAVVVGSLLCSFNPLPGQDKPLSREKVEELIKALNANTLIERSHAERELIELGPSVLSLLPAPELIETPSAREAIRRIRPQLEHRAARESSAPFEISLQGEFSLNDVINELRNQSKNDLKLSDEVATYASRRIKVDWTKNHFWDCLDDICQRTSLQWSFVKDAAAILIKPASEQSKEMIAVQRYRAFRLAVKEIENRPVVGDERHRLIRVDARLAVEPRLRPLFLTMAVENLKATANGSRPLPNWNPGAKYEFPVGDRGHDVQLQWDFSHPADQELTKLSIRGRLQCQIAAATERIAFDHTSLSPGKIRRRGGVTVRLREINFEQLPDNHMNADIGITVSYDNGGPAFESHRSWIFHNAVYLESKAGIPTPYSDFEVGQQADGAIAVDYRWRDVAGIVNQSLFVYEAPTLIIDVPIDVDLANLPVKPSAAESQEQNIQKQHD